ncbi:MAG: PAS domain-containing sensor histidine kinase [Lachnospiraceae bacterium]|nr:PAS domain-containing sensor histidine kinase [Lachnospiraceae bacterium]
MNKKIFNAIWIVAIVVFLASLIFIMGVSYNYFSGVQLKQLKTEAELASQGVSMSRLDYLNSLEAKDYRITWIDADGTVLFDNAINANEMENHMEREEIKEALADGYGESVRYSNTLSDKQLYSAIRLSDGSVIRLSSVQMAVWTLLMGFAQPICFVILIALALSFVLASRLTKRILTPINSIDPDDPLQHINEEEYKEIVPLLRRIQFQNEQLKRDQKEIEKAALIRQEFTANVSHELKTPLHAISGYAELLENEMVKEVDIKPFAGKIREESTRMTKLVEDIIDLTRLDNGGVDMKWEKCDIYRIAENAIDSLEVVASSLDVTVSIQGSDAPSLGVPQLLYSIIYNLCDNAIKYNHAGGSVEVTVQPKKYETIIIVKDTGIGISEESLERIFERFYRVDKSRSKEVGGTGLGLSIVKHAVMIHNGKIEVKSKVGEGTEMIVSIPNKQE